MFDTPPRTFGSEDRLPRVPVPDLEASAAQLLEWCAPLLSEGELAETKAAVAELLTPESPGRAAYARIQEYDATAGVHSWLDRFWDDRYLGRRAPTAINANFMFLLHDRPGDQHERAAGLVMGALDHKLAVDQERLPVTMQRGTPLSMEQHKYLFSSTRIPGVDRDRARTPYSEDWPGPSRERHVVVLVDAHLFRLDVIGPDGVPHTLEELSDALAEIARSATDRGQGVGHLTSLDRSEWARTRERLLEHHPGNRAAMDVVERALVAICLERSSPEGLEATCNELLAGDSGNRWFDKAVSFVVFPDGRAGVQGEHCKLDGTTMTELIDALAAREDREHERTAGAQRQGPPAWSRVDFVLDDGLRADVRRAEESFRASAGDVVGRLVDLTGVGSDLPKELGVSPDAFAQMTFQLAHHRAKGFLGATYESISLRRYHHGRTEAMRVVTPEIVRFVEAMADPESGPVVRAGLARAAATEHVARAKGCQDGRAPEQLIWELQLEERRHGFDSRMAVHESPGWRIMRDDFLSTSSAPTSNVVILGFGATSAQCIGVSYQLLPQQFTLYLSTPAAVADGMARFAEELPRAIEDLAGVLRDGSQDPAQLPDPSGSAP
jgi:carnitine O-acetyltransferase